MQRTLTISLLPYEQFAALISGAFVVRSQTEPSLQTFAKEGNTILTLTDQNGQLHYGEVFLNSINGLIYPPKQVEATNTEVTNAADINPEEFVGQYFVHPNSYRSPDIVRAIGATKKRVIVEKVPVVSHYDELQNGYYKIDMNWVNTHPMPQGLARKATGNLINMMPKHDGRVAYLYFKGESYYPISDMQEEYSSVMY